MLLASLFMNSVNFKAMPQITDVEESDYLKLPTYNHRPFYLPHRHLETIIPSMFYSFSVPNFDRERIRLQDGDFLDLDWLKNGNKRLIIVSHGMEGDTRRHYILRAANYFSERDWDILAWNQRGCSGELNDLLKMTHHGSHDELSEVVNHAALQDYDEIILLGFSMGGCQTLKYLSSDSIHHKVLGGVGFSVTFDFEDMMGQIEKPENAIYKKSFLQVVKGKYLQLAQKLGVPVDQQKIDSLQSFEDFHQMVSLKATGYPSLEEFYYNASPGNFMETLGKPMLVVNAQNDPLLGEINFSKTDNELLTTYYPKRGGHVGFSRSFSKSSFMEEIAEAFIEQKLLN